MLVNYFLSKVKTGNKASLGGQFVFLQVAVERQFFPLQYCMCVSNYFLKITTLEFPCAIGSIVNLNFNN